jgi:hypothetical protein
MIPSGTGGRKPTEESTMLGSWTRKVVLEGKGKMETRVATFTALAIPIPAGNCSPTLLCQTGTDVRAGRVRDNNYL